MMQRCNRCIMDETDPNIIFDNDGICNHCHEYDAKRNLIGFKPDVSKKKLDKLVTKIKYNSRRKKYDCVLGVSGGVDSSFILHYAVKELKLRVLAIHVDAGWNSDTAVKNIHNMCLKLGVQLHTVVVDWPTIRELQRAFFFSGLPNQDIPQDHAFLAATMKYANKFKIKYMLNGSNLATESILPNAWGYDATDLRHIKDVFKRNRRSNTNLRKYPKIGLLNYYKSSFFSRINILNYIDYSKNNAIKILEDNYGWIYYGGKHFESRFTKFFQSYFLPVRFGYDKRLAHLSSLILGGEISRKDALDMYLNQPAYKQNEIKEDLEYVKKKLDINDKEWESLMEMPFKSELDYKNSIGIKKIHKKLYQPFKKFRK